jgi:hypothetical protein
MDLDVSLTTVASTLTDVASSILILFRDAVELCFLVTLFFDGVFTVILPAVDLFFDLVTFDSDIWVSVVFDSKFWDSVAFAVEIADDFFDLVSFDSVVFVSANIDSKVWDSVVFAVVTADDLVGVGLHFFPPNFLKRGKLPVDLVVVGLDFFPLTILSFVIPAIDLVGGVILFSQLVS